MDLSSLLKYLKDNHEWAIAIFSLIFGSIVIPIFASWYNGWRKRRINYDIYSLEKIINFDWKYVLGWPKESYTQSAVYNLYEYLVDLDLTFKNKKLRKDYEMIITKLKYLATEHSNGKPSLVEKLPDGGTKVTILDIKPFIEETYQLTIQLDKFRDKGKRFIKVHS